MGLELEPARQAQPLKHRSVVSNFIVNGSNEDRPLVALFRRSEKVRTYRGKLAPISGTIDASDESPLQAATRELKEETGLTVPEDLELNLRGEPFSIEDTEAGRKWTVYPFSWEMKSPFRKFAIDWEHSEYHWFTPKAILSGEFDNDSVPHLSESLRRVWLGQGGIFYTSAWPPKTPFAGRLLTNSLRCLRDDHESGASRLAAAAMKTLPLVLDAAEPDPRWEHSGSFWALVKMIVWHLIHNGRDSMNAAIKCTLVHCLKTLGHVRNDRSKVLRGIAAYMKSRESLGRQIDQSFTSFIVHHLAHRNKAWSRGPIVRAMTLSCSLTIGSAILNTLRKSDLTFDLRILESRPLCEGAMLASWLIEKAKETDVLDRLKITVATDAEAAVMATNLDLVILGADRISSEGDVNNKIGSLAAVLCSKAIARRNHRTVQVVVLSKIEKVSTPLSISEGAEENNCADEVFTIWKHTGARDAHQLVVDNEIEVKNVYFEWVPAEYIDVYIAEKGEMRKDEIREQSHLLHALEKEMFAHS